ncbi:MAG: 16S rRNA (guanine(966)-N(2))-methyltransferase RsmD [Mariprofundaceae bacterium]|nr:16S rRNA (guanine(966)-N(2))-methyltransferase RsmD [Mariprofundaceae bacterium]
MLWRCWINACNRWSVNGSRDFLVRITAGSLRGCKVTVPDFDGVRPTPAKVRQALFNILGPVQDCSILELFSGSGLMALEALSRGAASVTSVEKNRRIVQHLKNVRSHLQLDENWQLICADVQAVLPRFTGRHFDIVFADPPYNTGLGEQLPTWLDAAGVCCTILVVEQAARTTPLWPTGWTQQQARRYGETCLHFLAAEAL